VKLISWAFSNIVFHPEFQGNQNDDQSPCPGIDGNFTDDTGIFRTGYNASVGAQACSTDGFTRHQASISLLLPFDRSCGHCGLPG
jgi:hypothetical protein